MIVAAIDAGDAPMPISNVCTVLPDGTTTTAGTVAAGVLLAREIDKPPAGAAAVSVTIPWTGKPATDTALESEIFWSVGTVTTVVTRLAV